ncbi:hypothetical protein COHA_002311 [Chlorella ohadii]|uniref:Uncharacterized protein n=1 Tax=Chlorella ohadii TaxID=2649997 RepID=A0AAD5H521_9CHLO|nr:hypothetical protein COHA_002311 [Chlorella ohadii]
MRFVKSSQRLQRAAAPRPGRPAAAATPPPPPPSDSSDQARRAEAQEALLEALRESGVPLANIQLGRADDDDEEWLDVLDAESDEWMRKPQVPEIVEELLGGDVAAAARQLDEEQRRRREERQRQQQQQSGEPE